MQNAVIGMIVGASFLGLTLVALRSRSSGWRRVALQLALGAFIGGLAAAVAVAVREDLVPDDVEVVIALVLVSAAAGTIAVLIGRHGE